MFSLLIVSLSDRTSWKDYILCNFMCDHLKFDVEQWSRAQTENFRDYSLFTGLRSESLDGIAGVSRNLSVMLNRL